MPVCTGTDTVRTDEGITWLPLLLSFGLLGQGLSLSMKLNIFQLDWLDQQAPEISPFLCGPLSRTGVTGIDNQAMPSPPLFFESLVI